MALTRITSDGITDGTITGTDLATNVDLVDNQKLRLGTGNDLQIFHNGTDSKITNTTGNLIIDHSNGIIRLDPKTNENGILIRPDGAVELYHNNVKQVQTTADGFGFINNCTFSDSKKIQMGSSNDLQIYHDGNNSFIDNTGTGNLNLYGDDINILNKAKTEFKAKFITNGAVELYYNNSKKTQTTTWGFQIIGDLLPQGDNSRKLGESNERWSIVYAANGSINTSDKTEKNTIVESDLGLDFVNKLKPISFKWNKDDGKTHYGLIAQDLEETILSLGKSITDFGGISKEEDSPMGLGYCELISPLIKAIQELSAEVAALKAG